MATSSFVVKTFDLRHLGACPTCMRISFLAMIGSWLLLLVAGPVSLSVYTIAGLAIFLTCLWLAHISFRALRTLSHMHVAFNGSQASIQSFSRALAASAKLSMRLDIDMSGCGQACSKTNDNCPAGCICWWELGKCVELS
jgi:hypothetical protein